MDGLTVNNFPFARYDEGEVEIQTNPKQLEATEGKVYLTLYELALLVECAAPGWYLTSASGDRVKAGCIARVCLKGY